MAAPLLMSVDLRTIRPEFKAILKNRKIIAVDQDPLGIQGRRIYKHKGIEIWSRPITPIYKFYYSFAVAFVNRRTDGTPSDVAVTLRELGLQCPSGYRVEDLYEEVDYGTLSPHTKIKVKVNPSGKQNSIRYLPTFELNVKVNNIEKRFRSNVFLEFGITFTAKWLPDGVSLNRGQIKKKRMACILAPDFSTAEIMYCEYNELSTVILYSIYFIHTLQKNSHFYYIFGLSFDTHDANLLLNRSSWSKMVQNGSRGNLLTF